MTNQKSNLDRFISYSAFFMSLLTLLIFFYQTHLMREESHLSVRPRIGISTMEIQKGDSFHFEFRITNKGLGPAILDSMVIIHEQQRNNLGFAAFFKRFFPKLGEFGELQTVTNVARGNALGANDHITLFRIIVPKEKLPNFLDYVGYNGEKSAPFEFEVTYSSIYHEQWRINSISEDEYPELL